MTSEYEPESSFPCGITNFRLLSSPLLDNLQGGTNNRPRVWLLSSTPPLLHCLLGNILKVHPNHKQKLLPDCKRAITDIQIFNNYQYCPITRAYTRTEANDPFQVSHNSYDDKRCQNSPSCAASCT